MELEHLEAFALGDDRKKALAALVPGTEDYYYYHCLHHEHEGELAKVDALFAVWIERLGESARSIEIARRRALLRLDSDPAAAATAATAAAMKQLAEDLDLRFDHAREAGATEVLHPSRLDANAI